MSTIVYPTSGFDLSYISQTSTLRINNGILQCYNINNGLWYTLLVRLRPGANNTMVPVLTLDGDGES